MKKLTIMMRSGNRCRRKNSTDVYKGWKMNLMPRLSSSKSSKVKFKKRERMTRSRIGITRICIGSKDRLWRVQRKEDMENL